MARKLLAGLNVLFMFVTGEDFVWNVDVDLVRLLGLVD